jgi:hypothetical protein
MLRLLFGMEPRVDNGLLAEASSLMNQYVKQHGPKEALNGSQDPRNIRLALLTTGLIRSLDELEQSLYASTQYQERVSSRFMEEMSAAEQMDYHRHIYYYKNALIRVFAILDKLGGFLNEQFGLEAQREKEKYSYFTVLRQMRSRSIGAALEQQLYELKVKHQDAMLRLKFVRNLEVHAMNEELADDLTRLLQAGPTPLEDLKAKLLDINQGYEVVCRALITVFRYLSKNTPELPKKVAGRSAAATGNRGRQVGSSRAAVSGSRRQGDSRSSDSSRSSSGRRSGSSGGGERSGRTTAEASQVEEAAEITQGLESAHLLASPGQAKPTGRRRKKT